MTSEDKNNQGAKRTVTEQDKIAIYYYYEAEHARGISSEKIYEELAKRYKRDSRQIQRYIREVRDNQSSIVNSTDEEKRAHRDKLVKVAKALLSGWLDTVRKTKKDEYELINKENYPPIQFKERISLKEIQKKLKDNLESVTIRASSYDLFDHFRLHLAAENPGIGNLENWIEKDPVGLIIVLKRLVIQKDFAGKCPGCPK